MNGPGHNLKARQRLRQGEYRKRKQADGLQQVVLYVPAVEYAAAKQGGLRPLQLIYGLPGASASAGLLAPDGQYSAAGSEKLATAAATWEKDKERLTMLALAGEHPCEEKPV